LPDQPTILRHWNLLRALAARGRGATLRELADEYGVNRTNIQRDLVLLPRRGFPLIHETGGYKLKHWRLDGRTPVVSDRTRR
jgi:predicted DNA-binding transcriptional regulator YafY